MISESKRQTMPESVYYPFLNLAAAIESGIFAENHQGFFVVAGLVLADAGAATKALAGGTEPLLTTVG